MPHPRPLARAPRLSHPGLRLRRPGPVFCGAPGTDPHQRPRRASPDALAAPLRTRPMPATGASRRRSRQPAVTAVLSMQEGCVPSLEVRESRHERSLDHVPGRTAPPPPPPAPPLASPSATVARLRRGAAPPRALRVRRPTPQRSREGRGRRRLRPRSARHTPSRDPDEVPGGDVRDARSPRCRLRGHRWLARSPPWQPGRRQGVCPRTRRQRIGLRSSRALTPVDPRPAARPIGPVLREGHEFFLSRAEEKSS